MKFSLHLASFVSHKYQTGVDPASYDIDEVIRRMGLQLGAIESVENFAEKYEGVLVARVVSCEKHPNADKLSLCMIDAGDAHPELRTQNSELIQVVCGAPNVREGLTVAWIPPGATVPSTRGHDPFVLEARELRGKVSNGMIASEKELDLSDNHEGILEISADDLGDEVTNPGTEFSKLYGLNDVVIDCENKMFTHRPDCFGNIGISRELSGIFGDAYSSPDWYKEPLQNRVTASLPLTTKNEAPELVPRFTIQAVADLSVGSSPMWLQAYLQRIGQKSINNIVDYTNFFMMETGQPLHAFDYDKVKKYCDGDVEIFPRMAVNGEKIALLNGKTIELTDQDIVIATNQRPIALAGVMGGAETEVDETTTSIIIECANFDMYAIRRTSMRHGLFTDAVTRFNKGQSPLQNDRVLAKMVDEVVRYAGGQPVSELLDIATFDLNADNLNHLTVSAEFINSRLGSSLSADEMKQLLENVEFEVNLSDPQSPVSDLEITVPFWRMDIAIPEDIVEEIGRLHGYFNLPIELPPRSSKPSAKNPLRDFKSSLRDQLSRLGANEVLTYSFVHGDLLEKSGIEPDKWSIKLRNALSPELQYYRPSLVPSLLSKVHGNLKSSAGSNQNIFAMFEIGKAHVKGHQEEVPEQNLPKQMRRLSFVVAADSKSAPEGSAYYHAKRYVDAITNGKAHYQPLDTNDYPITAPYQLGRSAIIMLAEDQPPVGVIGELQPSVRKKLKLPEYCAAFEIDIDYLMQEIEPDTYRPLSEFPTSSQDVTFETAADSSWGELDKLLNAELNVAHAESGYHYDLQPRGIYQEGDSDKKRTTFHITLTHPNKTLKTEEFNSLIDQLAAAAEETLSAKRI